MSKTVRPLRLEDLAKKLNVSTVTISKALRNHPDISPETTQKVKELAEKLGYMPNYMAKNLSSRKSNIIGLVVPKIAHPFFASVIESVYDAAFDNNYETVLTVSQEQEEREKKHILSLLSMRIDGLIISITQETKDLSIFKRIKQLKVPIIFIDRVPDLKDVSSVTVDDKGGAFSAVEYAIKKGYTKIAHIGGYTHLNIGKLRHEGFIEAMKYHDMEINPRWDIEGGFGEEDGYNGFKKLYKKGNLPEYILSVTYPTALGIYSAAAEVGVKIPEDIEVTCFGNNLLNRFTPSIFNFVNQPAKELGKEAVKLLLKKVNNPKDSITENIVLKTQLLISNKEIERELVA
ncbi:MAG: LacI family DNA-binding transcriptional regulator [Ignavibacteriaceae bacterium]